MTPSSGPPPGSGRALAPGRGTGPVLVLEEPLSLWGGMDVADGRVIDGRHPQSGAVLANRVVAMPSGRGSSSSSSVLAEAIRRGTAPAAILLLEPDPILALGSLVAAELYGRSCPVVVLKDPVYRALRTGDIISVEAGDVTAWVRSGAGD